jgi:hypothetical protein
MEEGRQPLRATSTMKMEEGVRPCSDVVEMPAGGHNTAEWKRPRIRSLFENENIPCRRGYDCWAIRLVSQPTRIGRPQQHFYCICICIVNYYIPLIILLLPYTAGTYSLCSKKTFSLLGTRIDFWWFMNPQLATLSNVDWSIDQSVAKERRLLAHM